MHTPSELEEIQRIAYEIWQIEGEPAGRDQEHWDRARRIFERTKAAPGADPEPGDPAHAPQPQNPGFEAAAPGMVPEMKEDPTPDLPEPPMGRFAKQLKDLPEDGR